MTVTSERVGRVMVVSMLRPAKRNAIDLEMTLGIDRALNEFEDDESLWAAVITGTSELFCAGTDVSSSDELTTARGGEYGLIRRQRSKPLIAAVEGIALGGGFEIALACDLIVASQTARFALPEALIGVVATSGALFRAMRALPINVAREMLIAGSSLDADRAYSLGLVCEVVESGQAKDAALGWAERICRASPVSVQQTLAAVAVQFEAADRAGWDATRRAMEVIAASDDMQEGISAFFDRRPPQWKGSR